MNPRNHERGRRAVRPKLLLHATHAPRGAGRDPDVAEGTRSGVERPRVLSAGDRREHSDRRARRQAPGQLGGA